MAKSRLSHVMAHTSHCFVMNSPIISEDADPGDVLPPDVDPEAQLTETGNTLFHGEGIFDQCHQEICICKTQR